ncbi:MAG: hypothetical protein H0X36_06635 [Sphingomonadaceae bacterium]|nr:hypothetical protein [Sphingomonadaceae bacterium]
MIRILIGSILGGIVQFVIGAIFWATPLAKLAFTALGDPETADLQTAMARTLTATGSGTYFVPSPETAAGTALMGKGPVALIFFNTSGFPPMDAGALLVGLVLSVVMLFLVGTALSLLDSFEARLKAMLLFAAATVLYFILAMPVYNVFLPWGWWIYLAVADFLAFTAGAFVLIRWFMPPAAPRT